MTRIRKSSRRFLSLLMAFGLVFSTQKLTTEAFTVKDGDEVLENPDGFLWSHSEVTVGSNTYNINFFNGSYTENKLGVYFDYEDLYGVSDNEHGRNTAKNNIFIFLNGTFGYGDFTGNVKARIYKDEESTISGNYSGWKTWRGNYTFEDPSGNDPSGNDPSGNDPSGNEPSGNNPIVGSNPITPPAPPSPQVPSEEPEPSVETPVVSEPVQAPVVKAPVKKAEVPKKETVKETEETQPETISENEEPKEASYEVAVKVVEASSIAGEDLKKIEEVLEAEKESNMQVLCYLDLSAFMDGNNCTELSEPVTITIEAPKDVVCKEGEEWVVIRVHEGETALLPVIDNKDGTLSFKNDKFSAFALAIREIMDEKPAKADTIESVVNLVEQKEQNRNFILWIILVLGIAVAAGVISVIIGYKKKK